MLKIGRSTTADELHHVHGGLGDTWLGKVLPLDGTSTKGDHVVGNLKAALLALAWLTGAVSATASAQEGAREQLSAQQAQLLDLMEGGARHVLTTGEHVPVTAFVMRSAGTIELVDLERSFAFQEEALTATLGRLVPMARAKQIIASGILFQPGDPGQEKVPVLIFDIEQVGHPRFLVTLTYTQGADGVTFGPKTFEAAPPKLFSDTRLPK